MSRAVGWIALALALLTAATIAVTTWRPRGSTSTPGRVVSADSTAAEEEASREILARLDAYEARIRDLQRQVEEGRRERLAIESKVSSLQTALAQARATDDAGAPPQSPHHAVATGDRARAPGSVDTEALVAAGFSEETVRSFKEKVDQLDLDRLYLRDAATREGWIDTPKFREQNEALSLDQQGVREEYGEEFYDWMLYTSGHPNRVTVGDVMTDSAAAGVGLRPGDQILSYDGQRIFAPTELREATSVGQFGDEVSIDVVRDGSRMRLVVPRGPLGIRVGYGSEEPDRVR